MDTVVAENKAEKIHVALDNLNTRNDQAAQEWLKANGNVTFHFPLTHASWVNLIECFFSILAKQGLQQSVHRSGQQLERFLKKYIKKYNERSGPFTWTKGPEKLKSIIKLIEDFQNKSNN